jgi:putative endopeptidase
MTPLAPRCLLALCLAGASAHAALDVKGLDPAIDRCKDFYGYANHKWLDANEIPADRTFWGAGSVLGKRNEDLLIRMLEEAAKGPLPPQGTATRKVVEYFASGMDEAQIRHWQLKPLAPFLGTIAELNDREAATKMIGEFHTRGIFAGFHWEVENDRKDSSKWLPEISQGGLGLPDRDYYFLDDERSKQVRDAYKAHIAKVLKLNGDDDATAAANAATIYDIESELAKASMTRAERRDLQKTYNKMTPAELEKLAPGFPWKTYLAAIHASRVAEVNVSQPEFTKRFAQLYAELPMEKWRPYLRWHLLRATSDKLDVRYESLHWEFYEKTLKGAQEPAPRAKRVLDIISGPYGTQPMAEAIGQLYVQKMFPPQAKARALQLVQNVKDALADRLKTVDWMTDETRKASLEKLAAMRIKVGYPDRWKDLSGANVGPLLFVDDWMSANMFAHERDLARIGKPVDRDEWILSPHVVNAYYNPPFNEIVFPAGILQPPFFDPAADDAVNYGAIGTVIGHEITHGFDDNGRLFDKDGNMRDWWSEADANHYKERAKKVEVQYGNYAGIDGIKLNGALTLGENIADVGGVKIAYLALQKAQKGKPVKKIDGLTPDQRFFISYAQAWRGKFRPDRERMLLRTDPHSPHVFRVRGPTANMPEFAKAFSCNAATTLLGESDRANIW